MKTVIAGALEECVHVAGVTNFLRMTDQAGWRTVFLGPAVQGFPTYPNPAQNKSVKQVGAVCCRIRPPQQGYLPMQKPHPTIEWKGND